MHALRTGGKGREPAHRMLFTWPPAPPSTIVALGGSMELNECKQASRQGRKQADRQAGREESKQTNRQTDETKQAGEIAAKVPRQRPGRHRLQRIKWGMLPWRNRLARLTVNQEVGSSSLPGSDLF
ncbi:hypothetical protein GQ42DRAFT_14464 [Ramicandelaber brevisporus]|nr:hypothetical protein GQ42DRAFT_14464 [Ramicandelaber brevisporus]